MKQLGSHPLSAKTDRESQPSPFLLREAEKATVQESSRGRDWEEDRYKLEHSGVIGHVIEFE
jgi:hypothetical protein